MTVTGILDQKCLPLSDSPLPPPPYLSSSLSFLLFEVNDRNVDSIRSGAIQQTDNNFEIVNKYNCVSHLFLVRTFDLMSSIKLEAAIVSKSIRHYAHSLHIYAK